MSIIRFIKRACAAIVLSVAVLYPAFVIADEKQVIRFNIAEIGFPPFAISKPVGGIGYDVLQEILEPSGYELEVIHVPEKRISQFMLAGKMDIQMTAPEFLEDPKPFIFTEGFAKVRDVIFVRKADKGKINKLEDLHGLRLGTVFGYGYPSLDEAFRNKVISRIDSRDETMSLRTLSIGGIDAAVITELVGHWLIQQKPRLQNQFEVSNIVVDEVPMRFMVNKDKTELLGVLDSGIKRLKQNNRLQEIIKAYTNL